MGLMLARILVIARLLDMSGFAEFGAGLLVSSTFCMLSCLGLYPLLQRDLPIMMVHRRERAGVVLMAQCVIVAVACSGLGLVAAATGLSVAGLTPALVAVGVLHGLSQQMFLIATLESRSRGEPLRFAIQNVIRALAVLSIGLLVAKASNSAFLSLAAEALVSLALVQATLRTIFRNATIRTQAIFSLAFSRFRRLRWRSATALLSVALVSFALLNADRWIAAEILTTKLFAQYTFAWTILVIAQSFQGLINTSLYPLIARRFARYGRRNAYRISARVSCMLLLVGTALSVPAWLVLDVSIVRWFPEYDAVRTLLPMFLGVAVVRASDFWSGFMVILGLEGLLLRLNAIAVLGAVLVWLTIIRPWGSPLHELWEFGLLATLLTLASYLVTATASWYVSKREVEKSSPSLH